MEQLIASPAHSPVEQHMPANEAGLLDAELRDYELRYCYRIGRLEFVLEKTLITEIQLKPVIYAIPNSPVWLHGMLNLRGNILPVIDLAATLGTDLKSNPGEFVLVLDRGVDALALLVDGLPRALTNPQAAGSLAEMKLNADGFMQPGVCSEEGLICNQLDVRSLVESLVRQEAAGNFQVK